MNPSLVRRAGRALCACLLVLTWVIAAHAAPARRAAPAAWLIAADGEVLVKRAAPRGSAPQVVPAPTPLSFRDDVEVHSGSAQIQLGSGRILDLSAGTTISIIGAPRQLDAFVLIGIVQVRPGAAEARAPITLAVAGGKVTLRSQQATVRVGEGEARVLVREGSANVSGRGAQTAIQPGQVIALRQNGALGAAAALPEPELRLDQVVARGSLPDLSPTPDNPVTVVPTPDTPAGRAVPVPSAASSQQSVQIVDHPFVEWTSLRVMRDKGYITQAEYDSALRDLNESVGSRAGKSGTLAIGKWATTIYGFLAADFIWNSTESIVENSGNALIARPDTFAGQHGRTEFSARGTRFGLRVAAPALRSLRASGVLEMDFIGASAATSEAGFYVTSPVLRLRHAYIKLETPVLNLILGQYWSLFGWQPSFIPAMVQVPGTVAEVFSRGTQLRLSHVFKTAPIDVELAVAVARPPQRDSQVPEFHGGVRLSFNKWTGTHTSQVSSTVVVPASIAVSGVTSYLALPELAAKPGATNGVTTMGIAADVFLPILRATAKSKGNTLSLMGEFSLGSGIANHYAGLTGGIPVNVKALPPATAGGLPASYPANFDSGLATYDKDGNATTPQWLMFLVNAEYYLPRLDGRVGLFAVFSRSQLLNPEIYANPTKVRDNQWLAAGGLFGDVSEAVRVALDYSHIEDTYVDGVTGVDHGVHLSGFFFF